MTQAVDRLSHMRTHAVISRAIAAIACQIFKKRAKWARRKSAFDYKAVNGLVGLPSGRYSCLHCLFHISGADKSCSAQEKVNLPIIESSRADIAPFSLSFRPSRDSGEGRNP